MIEERTELRVSSGYFDAAIDDQDGLIEEAREILEGVEFDTLVATGLSGTCVAPMLARELEVNFLIVRKPDDLSTHSSSRGVGHIGRRWVFLDDFISSGATRARVLDQVKQLLVENRGWEWSEALGKHVEQPVWETTYVGTYEYARYRFNYAEEHMEPEDAHDDDSE